MTPPATAPGRWPSHLRQLGQPVWAIVLGATLILITVGLIVQQAVQYERQQAFANAQDINSKMVLSDEVRIRSLLASLDKVLLVLRQDFAATPLTRQALLQRLDTLQLDNELRPRLSFVDAKGNVVLTSVLQGDDRPLTLNIADRAYFQQRVQAQEDLLQVGMPVQSRINGRWMLPLTRRMVGKDGAFAGIVTLTVDPTLFTAPFGGTSLGANASRSIMRLDGYTLLRLNDGKLGYGGDTRKSQLFVEVRKAKVGCYTAVAASDGILRAVCYRVMDPYGIVIVAGSAVASIEASYRDTVWAYGVAAGVFAVLIVLLCGALLLGLLRQRTVLEGQQRFNQLMELLPQLVCGLDMQGQVVWVNRRVLDYIGPSAQAQAQGYGWVGAAVHPDDQGRVRDFVMATVQHRSPSEACEYRLRRFDGAYRWFSTQPTSVAQRDGDAVSFLQTGTDIHDRKEQEERARLTQKLESMAQLSGGMAHDFNNLLAIIVGNLELLKPALQAQGDAVAQRLEVAMGAAQRGVGLVKSMLALASTQPLLPSTVDLWALMERIAPLLRHAAGPQVQVTLQPPASPVNVNVDEAGLEAVLLNLMVNARDAMPGGGQLGLRLEASQGMARVVVQDNGTGMSEAVLQRATEPFFTTKARGHGTGLGLSMVAGFVKQSGGTLQLQSTPGEGTMVALALPLVAPALARTGPAPLRALPKAEGPRQRILVVDDEPELAELVRAWAMADGHRVVLAYSADDAEALLAHAAFDVLLTDILMPGRLGGIGLAERAHQMAPAMKIVLMSGYSRETASHRAELPWPLLVKPFRQADLLAALDAPVPSPSAT